MEERAERPTIVYFGNDWVADNRTSSHHIARRLAGRARLIYVESPGLRAPRGGSGRDLQRVLAKLRMFLSGPRQVGGGVTVQTLLQIPFHRYGLVRWANRELMAMTIRLLLKKLGVREPISWFVVPHVEPLCGRIGEKFAVYYCIDDYATFPDVEEGSIRAMDDALTRKADLVFVASETLTERKRALNPNTRNSPHGVDFDHFKKAQDPGTEVPADIRDIEGPVVGFFGLIEKWTDLPLIAYLAERRPSWTFVMIGRLGAPPETVPRLPNIRFLGQRPYDRLPAYGKRFDAAILPYHVTGHVMHINPLKLREYLAMGKPIVSARIPYVVDHFADIVGLAGSPEEFLEKLDAAVTRPSTPEEVQARWVRVADSTWDARVEEVWATVCDNLRTHPGRG